MATPFASRRKGQLQHKGEELVQQQPLVVLEEGEQEIKRRCWTELQPSHSSLGGMWNVEGDMDSVGMYMYIVILFILQVYTRVYDTLGVQYKGILEQIVITL